MISKLLINSNKYSVWILASIIVIRLYLVTLPSFRIDMNSWLAWSARLVEVTPLHFYAPNYFADYLPGYLYILWFIGKSFQILFSPLSIFSNQFEIYLKFITNLFDFGTAYFIYKIVARYNRKWANWSSLLYLGNPALTFNSSVMGQVDGVPTFFLIYAIYLLLESKKATLWGIVMAIAGLIKPQVLVVLPIMLLALFKQFSIKQVLTSIIIFISLPFILSSPFFLNDPIFGLIKLLQKSVEVYPFNSIFAYNFWGLFGWWQSDINTLFHLTYRNWGVILFGFTLILIFIPLTYKKYSSKPSIIYMAFALSAMDFFLFLTRIHERYLFPVFALFLIAVSIKKTASLIWTYILLSFIHLINLWQVYFYYNYVYNDPAKASIQPYAFISQSSLIFTMITLIIFVIILRRHLESRE